MSTLAYAYGHQRDDYIAFCEIVRRLTAIDLLQYKRSQMERRIRSFALQRGQERLEDYAALIASRSDELDGFLDRMTINVSQLWRNPEQWELLGRELVPAVAERGAIRAWSAGCSYGAEAYSLAAVCLESAPAARVRISATDIDARVIARARAGRFSDEDARTAPRRSLERWFEREGDTWCAGSELRSVVSFQTGDLLRTPVPRSVFDLVLCRNVIIYLTDPARDELHRRLATALRPGGYLLIGSTERVNASKELGLVPVHPFVYRKA